MLPVFTYDQIVNQLTDEGHAFFGESRQKFDVQTGGTLIYDTSTLNAAGQMFAKATFNGWCAKMSSLFQTTCSRIIRCCAAWFRIR